jgi:hypothetical protein
MSVVKSLEHASMRCGKKLNLQWVDSSNLEPEAETADPVKYHDAWRAVCSAKGIIVPGGFGHRGTEGMIAAVKWAREKKVPFLGICLGFQIAVIEWARNVCGLEDAHSAELAPETPHPVIVFMPEISKTHLGGTMRLGLRPTLFESGTEKSKLRQLYGGEETIWERHRHRYEVGPEYVERLEQPGGMRFIGKDERGERMQVLEMDGRSFDQVLKINKSRILNVDVLDRPPLLCRSSSPSRILHPTSEPLSSLPRTDRRRLWQVRARRPDQPERQGVPRSSPGRVQGDPRSRTRFGARTGKASGGQGHQGR